MGVLPVDLMRIIGVFAPLFSERAWRHVPVLLGGAILAPGQRTVTAVLRVMGFGRERCFHKCHRVLSHARWSVLAAGRLLLGELLAVLAPTGPVVMGLDDTIERRWGERIAARGIYRDPVRSALGSDYSKRSKYTTYWVALQSNALYVVPKNDSSPVPGVRKKR